MSDPGPVDNPAPWHACNLNGQEGGPVSGDRSVALAQAVRTNCHIADARHAADLPLCDYLLQMRELFRWERGLAFGAEIGRASLGRWLARREALWAELEELPFVALPAGGRCFDAYDVGALNVELAPLGLVYGAGLEAAGRPTFFLAASLGSRRCEGNLELQVCGRERARSLFAPPAALVGGHTIVLRRESLQRWLWEKFEAFSQRRAEGPMQALALAYGLNDAGGFSRAAPRLVDDLCEVLVLHEVAEHRAGQWLGPGWAAMRMALDQRRTDLRVRALRDLVADLETTLPALLERGHEAGLHFWFANYEGLRKQLFPGLVQGYAAWRCGDAGESLLQAARAGSVHFRALAMQVLALHRSLGWLAGAAIEQLLAPPHSVFVAPAKLRPNWPYIRK